MKKITDPLPGRKTQGDGDLSPDNASSIQNNPKLNLATEVSPAVIAKACNAELLAIADLTLRLARAAQTLRDLPPERNTKPSGSRSSWPDFIQETRFLHDRTRSHKLPSPNPVAIDDLNHLLGLLWHLQPAERQLVWARACGVPWAKLVARIGRSRTTLNREHKLAVAALSRYDQTNSANKTLRPVHY